MFNPMQYTNQNVSFYFHDSKFHRLAIGHPRNVLSTATCMMLRVQRSGTSLGRGTKPYSVAMKGRSQNASGELVRMMSSSIYREAFLQRSVG